MAVKRKGAVLAAILGSLVASGSAAAQSVSIGVQPWLGYGPLWIAAEKGFFEAHGVDATLVNFTWDQDMSAALASGNIQVQAAATNTLISLINTGVDVKAFVILDAAYEADAIIAPREVTSVEQLAGLNIAYERGATSDLLLNYALRGVGMSIDDVTSVQMAASDAGLALVAGRVEAAVTYEPYISAAMRNDENLTMVFTGADAPGLISDVLIAETSFIEANQETLVGIVRAWNDAVTFYRENPEEGGAIIAEAVGSPLDEFKVAMDGVRLYDLSENAAALGGEYQAMFTNVATIMNETNPDTITILPDPAEVVLTSIVESAAQ